MEDKNKGQYSIGKAYDKSELDLNKKEQPKKNIVSKASIEAAKAVREEIMAKKEIVKK